MFYVNPSYGCFSQNIHRVWQTVSSHGVEQGQKIEHKGEIIIERLNEEEEGGKGREGNMPMDN